MSNRTTIIAEAGVNHNGDGERALEMIDVAADCGVDMVKFQAFKAELLASAVAPKAEYQLKVTADSESHVEMLRALELEPAIYPELRARCAARGIGFLVTPFDLPSLRFLVNDLGMEVLKIPSGEITNGPLLLEAGRSGRRIILSTGLCTLDDIKAALGAIAHGMIASTAPSEGSFRKAYESSAGQQALRQRVTLLHCVTEYPAPAADANLRALDTLAKHFALPVGLSDHTEGFVVAAAAVARGARVIEKHFTLDRNLPGPDHKASLEPAELRSLVQAIRTVEAAMGDGEKRPRSSEAKNMAIARKSLIAAKPIKRGETFTADNLTAKRPGSGISPMKFWHFLGRPASRDYEADELIAE